jgi:acetate kinase
VKYIGSYAALANGVDAVIFSGWIGERSSYLRNEIKKNLTFLGKTKFLMIPTDEELMIAKECKKLK